MLKQKVRQTRKFKSFVIFTFAVVFCFSALWTGLVVADQYDEKIRQINQQTQVKQQEKTTLSSMASSLSDKINKLQAEINAMQTKINNNRAQADKLQKQIVIAEAELAKQKKLLGENIKTMYLEGQISTLEMLASSKDLSDFVDKQTYRNIVKDKITSTLDKIRALKNELKDKKNKLEKNIEEQKAIQSQLDAQKAESNSILSLNQDQQNSLNQQIQQNYTQISSLRRQQAIENAKHGSGVVAGDPSRGGYPAIWANSPQDSLIDSWGMFNRECVSYTAWRVYASGRYMPYWGGRGNANQWPNNTNNKSHTPHVGDVAVAYWGYYGHTMYVEAISGNQIYVSQYNYGIRGEYSEMWINISEIDWFLSF